MTTTRPRTARKTRRPGGETEKAFIDVSRRLFAERGYNGTSIADIAKELGLTTASLYYYVSGKQQLLLKVLEAGISTFLTRLEDIAATDAPPRDKLRLAVENHLRFVLEKPEAVAVFLREKRFLEPESKAKYEAQLNRYDKLFASILGACMEAGVIPREDPRLVRLAILGMINWAVEWYRPQGQLSAEEISRGFTRMIMDRMLRAD